MLIRPETRGDAAAIHALVHSAFLDAEHAGGDEAGIIARLRADNALSVSLVAVTGAAIVGHVAFSPVTIGGRTGWHGLGPLAVRKDRRREGIGATLIRDGLAGLRAIGAEGCVVLGAPAYYGRFGFLADPAITLAGVPPEYFQCLRLQAGHASGPVLYHRAFDAA